MNSFDLIIRHGAVVTAEGKKPADIGIVGEKIAEMGSLNGTAKETIDATGLHIFPGVIDAHVHFNEPGRTEWEGLETGSRAVAAGGGTMFFDMPLNSHPPTIDRASFAQKRAAAEAKSVVDFGLWGGLVPENLDKLEELAECGVIGFKAFMSNSGIDDFHHVDDNVLREGMKRAAKLNLIVAVHAESDLMTGELSQKALASGKTGIRDYLNSRPIEAELEAIQRAINFSGETGCALHVVHVSSATGVNLINEAQAKGINVSCETCPHYLVLTDEDVERLGAVAKCAPPIRSLAEQEKLAQKVLAGNITTIGSDHSPAPPDMKTSANFFKVWGGISGAQHVLPLMLTRFPGAESLLTQVLSGNIARRFHLPKEKGKIAVGADADLALVRMNISETIRAEELFYRHKQSPYVGRALNNSVIRTLVRGETVFQDGKIIAKPSGRLIKPLRQRAT